MCSGCQLGGAAQQSRRGAQRSLGFHKCTGDIVVSCELVARYVVAHLLLVPVDVVGHHGQDHGRVARHGDQSAAERVTVSAGLLGQQRECIGVWARWVGSVAAVTRVPVREDLNALEGYHSPQVDVRVRLNTNESPFAPPAAWRDAFAAELSRVEWNRYPERAATQLREGIAAQHGVRPAQVFAANGSNEVLQTLLLTFAGPGRTVATFEPTYQLHGHIARLTGASVAEGERAADFTLDLAEVHRVLTESSPVITFLCSPNNPTGLVEPEANVREVLAVVPGLLVVDEAYGQFADWSAIGMIDDDTNLVVTRTFSKTWSMAGSRLGYLVGPEWLVAELDKVVLPYHLDAAKQIAGRLALTFVDEMEDRVQFIVAERERLSAAMSAMAVDVFPSGANFILFRPRDVPGRQVWQSMLDNGVLIRDCSGWPRLGGCLRVTIGTVEENELFLAALAAALVPEAEK